MARAHCRSNGLSLMLKELEVAKYVIQYDLSNADGQRYETLIKKLEEAGAVRATKSSWFLASNASAIQLRGFFEKFMHKNDVIAVNVLAVDQGFGSSNLTSAAVAWMNNHLKTPKSAVR